MLSQTVTREEWESRTQPMASFYIADTHFGHENVLQYDKRPFVDLGEMEIEDEE